MPNVDWLKGPRTVLATMFVFVFSAPFNALWIAFGIVGLKLVVRRFWLAALLMTAFLVVTSAGDIAEASPFWLAFLAGLVPPVVIVWVLFRFGLLATTVMFYVTFMTDSAVLTLNASAWFFPASTMFLLLVAALAVYGFVVSRGGEPLLGRTFLD